VAHSFFCSHLTFELVDLSHFEKMTYYGASGLTFSIASITLSKISFGITLLRLTDYAGDIRSTSYGYPLGTVQAISQNVCGHLSRRMYRQEAFDTVRAVPS
jgi:hypothetical protein